jgi:hypothetical protein
MDCVDPVYGPYERSVGGAARGRGNVLGSRLWHDNC